MVASKTTIHSDNSQIENSENSDNSRNNSTVDSTSRKSSDVSGGNDALIAANLERLSKLFEASGDQKETSSEADDGELSNQRSVMVSENEQSSQQEDPNLTIYEE